MKFKKLIESDVTIGFHVTPTKKGVTLMPINQNKNQNNSFIKIHMYGPSLYIA